MNPARILVVDDEPHALRVVKLGLDRKGYDVTIAHDGLEALERLTEHAFDVVITDMQMPHLDGRGLCEGMQAVLRGPRPLTLVVSGSTEEALRDWAKTLDNTEFIEKPLSLRRLSVRLDEHFGGGELVVNVNRS